MKKHGHKFFLAAAQILLTLLLLCLSSCSGSRGPIAMQYEDTTVTEGMYLYYMSHYKSVFINNYSSVTDTAEFWASDLVEGMTAEEYFSEVIEENVKKNLAGAYLFDYMKLSFNSGMKDAVKDGIKDLCVTLCDGDYDKFDEMLAEYGLDRDILYDVYVMDAKVGYAHDYLYGDYGIIEIPDADKMIYLKENYSHIQHIYINNKYSYILDENGNRTYEQETGKYYTQALTDEQQSAADAKIEAVRNGLEGGGDFDALWDEYSEDKLYDDGYYLLPETPFISEIVTAAFELDIGEVTEIETEHGVHFIKRYDMEGSPWDDAGSKDFFEDFMTNLKDHSYTVMLGQTTESITVNRDIINKYKLSEVKPNRYV